MTMIAEVGTALKIAEFLSRLARTDKRADVVDVLRFLRFDDDGIVSEIDKLIAGKKVQDNEWEAALPNFNDKEWEVQRACNTIAYEVLANSRQISRFDRIELDRIRECKLNVRVAVQNYLNRERHHSFDITELKPLRADITQLNALIDAAEHKTIRG